MGLDAVVYDENEAELASKRVGNISHVTYLREVAARSLGVQSIVVSKVLYSGTHSGDCLTVAELQPLATELRIIESTGDADVRAFAHDMLELVHAALSRDRPIHFA